MVSNRLNASPNLPANADDFFPKDEERLVRLLSSLFLGFVSSIDRRKSTFDEMLVSSMSSNKSGEDALSLGLWLCGISPGDTAGFELFSCSRKKSRFDSRYVLTGRGFADVLLDLDKGSPRFSMLGRPPSKDGLDEELAFLICPRKELLARRAGDSLRDGRGAS